MYLHMSYKMFTNPVFIWITSLLLFCGETIAHGSESNETLKTCETIPNYEGCACQMTDTKEVVGLQFLLSNDTQHRIPRFVTKDKTTEWFFAFHPCGSFNMFQNMTQEGDFACIDDAVARFTNESTSQCSGLGKQSTGTFSLGLQDFSNISNLTLTFRNMSAVDKGGMTITLICNKKVKADDSVFVFINKTVDIQTTYFFSLESECCCPGVCRHGIKLPVKKKAGNNLTFRLDISEQVSNKYDDAVWYIVGAIIVLLLLIILVFIIVYAKFHPRSASPDAAPLLT